jgi:hypothetical protein
MIHLVGTQWLFSGCRRMLAGLFGIKGLKVTFQCTQQIRVVMMLLIFWKPVKLLKAQYTNSACVVFCACMRGLLKIF